MWAEGGVWAAPSSRPLGRREWVGDLRRKGCAGGGWVSPGGKAPPSSPLVHRRGAGSFQCGRGGGELWCWGWGVGCGAAGRGVVVCLSRTWVGSCVRVSLALLFVFDTYIFPRTPNAVPRNSDTCAHSPSSLFVCVPRYISRKPGACYTLSGGDPP